MITSNINEILISSEINAQLKENNKKPFINTLIDSNNNEKISKNTDLSFDNIKGISIEEIDNLFENQNDNQMAKNLRLATLFTDDIYLGKALFNTVLGEPFNLGYNYLSNMYEDKHSFLNMDANNSLADLLHENITNKIDDNTMKSTDKISQTRINEVLAAANSFSFVDALTTTYKDQYDKYKEDNQYSFLYNDYNLKYQELKYKYEGLKDIDNSLINQYK